MIQAKGVFGRCYNSYVVKKGTEWSDTYPTIASGSSSATTCTLSSRWSNGFIEFLGYICIASTHQFGVAGV
jgi:hypothetical protein